METALATKAMTYKEAKACVDGINSNMNNIRALVLDLYERKGWDALGYESWRECVVKEFKQGENYLYKQLAAAQAEKNICTTVQIPERQIRPLTRLNDDPEKQRVAWQKAVETAPEGKVTAAHVQKVVREMVEHPAPRIREQDKIKAPSYAMDIATFVISHLERIQKDDPKHDEALDYVAAWIAKQKGGKR
jgi:hypothetical protein